jgi:hypothetical protein
MEYLIGVILTLAVVAFAAVIGFDRERAFYPTVLIVIASYYALFAVMGASTRTLIIESIVAGIFVLFAVLGFKVNYWLVIAALIGHGLFDFVHRFFIDNPGVPQWWPGFCLASDVVFGALLDSTHLHRKHGNRASVHTLYGKGDRLGWRAGAEYV